MPNDLDSYIKKSRQYGFSDAEIQNKLLSVGWSLPQIQAALLEASGQKPKLTPKRPTDTSVTDQTEKMNHLKLWGIRGGIAFLILVLIALGGYVYAASQGYIISGLMIATPQKIWNNFLGHGTNKIYKTKYTVAYKDTAGINSDMNSSEGLNLKDINLSVDGTSYANTADPKNLQAQSKLQYSFGSGNSSFTTGFEYRLIDKEMYLNLGDNPFLSSILNMGQSGQKSDWLKLSLDPSKYQNYGSDAEVLQKLSDQQFLDSLTTTWSPKNYITLEKYLGRESINGTTTLHYRAQLNKQGLKQVLQNTYGSIAKLSDSQNNQDQQDFVSFVNALVDKISVKDFELWVGMKDLETYRIHLESNAPSILSALNAAPTNVSPGSALTEPTHEQEIKQVMDSLNFSATFTYDANFYDFGKLSSIDTPEGATDLMQVLGQAQSTSRDDRRISDMRMLASALELYYNDNNKYPATLQDLTPRYLGQIPIAPKPADGSCSEPLNGYTYASTSRGQNYTATFCLGARTNNYDAGIHSMSSSGIK